MTAEVQAQLFDESQFPAGRELLLPPEVQQHRFTGEQVARNRERYEGIVRALGEGLGIRQICRAFAVSQHTVEGIRDRDAMLVATEKERAAKHFRRLLRMSMELLEENLEAGKITGAQLPITVGILADKSLLWDGQPTSVVAVRHEVNQDALRRMFAEFAGPVIDVEASPIPLGRAPEIPLGPAPDCVSGGNEPKPLQIGLECADSAAFVPTFPAPTGIERPDPAPSTGEPTGNPTTGNPTTGEPTHDPPAPVPDS